MDSFCRFSGESPGGLREHSVCRESARGEIWWKSLCFALCLFAYLFNYHLYIYFLFTLKKLFIRSYINSVVQRCGRAISMKLCSDISEMTHEMAHFVLLWVCCRMWEQLAFFFNLLLSLFMSIKTFVKYSFFVYL